MRFRWGAAVRELRRIDRRPQLTWTVTLALSISDEAWQNLVALASASGRSAELVAAAIIERAIVKLDAAGSLSEFRDQVSKSGITEEQLDAFFEELREEVWRERRD